MDIPWVANIRSLGNQYFVAPLGFRINQPVLAVGILAVVGRWVVGKLAAVGRWGSVMRHRTDDPHYFALIPADEAPPLPCSI